MPTAGYTMGMSSLTGGYTFHDTMSPAFDPTPPGMSTGAPGPGVLLRGHGFAQAGLRHVEGLPVPEPKSDDPGHQGIAPPGRRDSLFALFKKWYCCICVLSYLAKIWLSTRL